MRTIKNKISALVLGVCLLVSLAVGGVAAYAANTMNQGVLKVTVTKSTEAKFVDDLKSATVVVDLYKIADATPNTTWDIYDYSLLYGLEFKKLASGETDWEQLAADAAKAVEKKAADKTKTKAAGEESVQFDALADGLYLVYAHGAKGEAMAKSAHFGYTFKPYVVALPTKEADENGVIMTSNVGEWIDEAEVGLKPQRFPLYGAIEIEKVIDGEVDDEDATFVFHLTGTAPQGDDYDNYASVTIPAGKLSGKKLVDHIPAGTELTVAEVYAAGRYDIKGEDITLVDQTTTVIADDTDDDQNHNLIRFSVKNKPGDDNYGGHGVENNFRYSNDSGKWEHEADPADKVVDKDSLIQE